MEQPSILSKAYNCDCLEYMKSLPDNYFDLAIADPPYGIGASKPSKKPSNILQKNGSIMSASVTDFGKKDWDNNIPTQEFFDELRRVSKNQIIWGANYFGLQGGMIVWDKINGNSDQYDCEIAYQSFNKRTDLVHYMWNGMFQGKYCGRDIRQAAVQQGNKALNEKRIHPTQKPVLLYEWLLNNYAKKGDRIFDPMMGSQSSRIAAYRLGFDYVGCELDKEYYDKGCTRFDSMFSKNKQTVGGGIQTASMDIQNKVYHPEDAVIVKAALVDHLQNFTNPTYGNGEIGDSEIIKEINKYSITDTETAREAAKSVCMMIGPSYTEIDEDPDVLAEEAVSFSEDILEQKLRELAKLAIRDRIVTPSARRFTPEQVNIMNRYYQVTTPDIPANEVWERLLDEVEKEPDVARKPEKWVTDTAKELDGLAEGITREQGQGLKR